MVVESGRRPPFFNFTREPGDEATALEKVRLVADEQHLAAAGGHLERVEVAPG